MKLFRNIQILLWAIVPMVLVAQETAIDWTMRMSTEQDETAYRDYIPYYHCFPLYVNINLFFIQKDNGTGNFQENNAEHQRLWDEILAGISKKYTEIQDSKLDSCFAWRDPFLSDSRIRFKFNRYYLKNSSLWDWKKYGKNPDYIFSRLREQQKEIERDSKIPRGICIFFPENGDVYDEYMDIIVSGDTISAKDANYAYTLRPSKNEVYPVCMPDTYCKFLRMKHIVPKVYALAGNPVTWEDNVWYWEVNSIVTLLAHELGHSFNLDHECIHYKEDFCRDALMSPSGKSGYSHVYIPPTEVGKMHEALMKSRLQELVSKDLPVVSTMTITHNLNWDAPFRCYADLDIAKSGSVDMYGAVQMPKKAKIEVSGQLYARSADIQCSNPSDNWQGIRVKSGGLLYLENTTISSHDIIMEPGSTLILSGSIEFKNGHKAVLGSGVYVCVASSFTDKSVSKSFYVNGTPSTVLKNGKASGVTSKYAVTCSSIGWQRFQTRCTAIEDILYVQNKTLTQDETFVGKTILIGNSVDENRVKGDVVIKSPARATFIYTDRILFDKGFRCESGGNYRALQCK